MSHTFKAGDIVYTEDENAFTPLKILKIEAAPDQSETWHVTLYRPLDRVPKVQDIEDLTLHILHAPIAGRGMQATLIDHRSVTPDELDGYFEYLKQTDFRRYLTESGQSLDDIIAQAQDFFAEGNRLCDEKDYPAAIEAYTQAIDVFPAFYEAIDNRAFAQMDIGNYEDAVLDFERSLELNPESFVAQFSLGECYARMGDLPQAKAELEKALQIEDHPAARDLLQKVKAALASE